VIVSFRPGYPEISPRNLTFTALKGSGQFVDDQVHGAVAPRPGEIVVIKRRVSAFSGSDLEVILRGHDINHLILTGIATSGVVLSTLRQAADADYRLTVPSDCCLDDDAEVHSVLVGKIFPRQATVTTAESLIVTLASPNSG
jgi:nicotinamidase-related amidase